MELTAISLFSGIGGMDIAAELAGFKTLAFVEWDKFCQKILRKHWPDVPIHGDIDEFDARQYRGTITLVHGGDPCQPSSVAGQRRGSEDDRYKWPQMLRVIRECRPAWVVNENPTGRLTMDFYQVLSGLEGEGYETRSFVIPACAINAPHRRDRLYIVAYNERSRCNDGGPEREGIQGWCGSCPEDRECVGDVADTTIQGFQGICESEQPESLLYAQRRSWEENWLEVATSLCGVDDGLPYRVARLKALGNAQVPQQCYNIYRAIALIERGIINENTDFNEGENCNSRW